MNEKEKARELVRECYYVINGNKEHDFDLTLRSHHFVTGGLGSINEAKQCALIAVDLMLNEYKELNERPEKLNHFVKRPEYWQAVRAEIELL